MFDLSQILHSAWAGYARDARLRLVPGHFGNPARPFNRAHFAYCLRMAWAVAKEVAAKAAASEVAGPVATVLGAVNLLDAVTAAPRPLTGPMFRWQHIWKGKFQGKPSYVAEHDLLIIKKCEAMPAE